MTLFQFFELAALAGVAVWIAFNLGSILLFLAVIGGIAFLLVTSVVIAIGAAFVLAAAWIVERFGTFAYRLGRKSA